MASVYRKPGTNQIFKIAYRLNGKRYVRSLGTRDPKMARLLKKEWEVKLGKNQVRQTGIRPVDAYLEEYRQDTTYRTKTTNSREMSIVRRFIALTGKKTINSMSREEVARFMERYEKLAPKSHNEALQALRRFFRPAVQREYILKNPVDGFHRRRVPQTLPKFFTDEEYSKMEKAAELLNIYPFLVTARYTGLRLRELLNLEWEDFDWERKLLRVINKPQFGHTVKNYQVRIVPICDELREKLGPFIKKDGLCFPTYGRWRRNQRYLTDGPKRQLRRLYDEAGIPRDRKGPFHRLRHTFASRLVQNNVPIYKVSKWLGHSSVTVTEIYAKFAPVYDEDIEKLSINPPSSQAHLRN